MKSSIGFPISANWLAVYSLLGLILNLHETLNCTKPSPYCTKTSPIAQNHHFFIKGPTILLTELNKVPIYFEQKAPSILQNHHPIKSNELMTLKRSNNLLSVHDTKVTVLWYSLYLLLEKQNAKGEYLGTCKRFLQISGTCSAFYLLFIFSFNLKYFIHIPSKLHFKNRQNIFCSKYFRQFCAFKINKII